MNVANTFKHFHKSSTSGAKPVPSSFGTEKWKKKSDKGNKTNQVATQKGKKNVKVAKGNYFHYNQEGHSKQNCPKYLAKKKPNKVNVCLLSVLYFVHLHST